MFVSFTLKRVLSGDIHVRRQPRLVPAHLGAGRSLQFTAGRAEMLETC